MKTLSVWLIAGAYTVGVLTLWLHWPQVATWASQFGWPRESFLNANAVAAFWGPGGMLLLLAWIGVFFATLSAIIDGNTEEQKRLRAGRAGPCCAKCWPSTRPTRPHPAALARRWRSCASSA